jgi:hypothetical protein
LLHNIRLPIALAIAATSSIVSAEPDPWFDWVVANSPNGFDVTPDGTIWINMNKPGLRDDFAVRAGDLRDARQTSSTWPKFWVRGYHIKNKDVPYRETKSQLQIDCAGEKIATLITVQYDATGNVHSQYPGGTFGPIIPGTYGASYHRLFCQPAPKPQN